MQLELRLSNDTRTLPSVCAFTRETLRQFELPDAAAGQLEQLVGDAVAAAVQHAYPAGEDGVIQLTIRETHGKLEILIRDFGLPQDVGLLERQLHDENAGGTLFGAHASSVADELHWLNFGRDGKALQIIKWLHTESVADQGLTPFHDDPPPAPPQKYTVRRMRAEDAVQVSQLMYRAYGNTYFNADVYYPERVIAQDAHGSVLSFVALAENGAVVGHYALERNQEGPVAETGQAVVDPAHRSRGLLDLMLEAVVDEARRLDLVGHFADAVAVHAFTQKSNVKHHGHLTAVELGISPKTEKFRNLAETLPQRVTCLLYFHWLKPPTARTIFVPERHRDIVTEIYANLGCPVTFATAAPTAPLPHGALTVKFDADASRAFVTVTQPGADTAAAIRHAKKELVERSRAEVVFADVPLDDPAAPGLTEQLEQAGFGFAGVAPHFARRGDLLRLVYLVEPLAREAITTVEPFAGRLVDYALAEQRRCGDAS